MWMGQIPLRPDVAHLGIPAQATYHAQVGGKGSTHLRIQTWVVASVTTHSNRLPSQLTICTTTGCL
jgi:hypothetical protein